MTRWWVLLAVGAVFLLGPGVINPFTVVTGSTILGLGLVAWASYQLLLRGRR